MRPSFRSIRPRDCKCLPGEICRVCRSWQGGCASETGPAYVHTWIEAVRIHNAEVRRRRKKTLDKNKRIPV
jgi:hypothetical protein